MHKLDIKNTRGQVSSLDTTRANNNNYASRWFLQKSTESGTILRTNRSSRNLLEVVQLRTVGTIGPILKRTDAVRKLWEARERRPFKYCTYRTRTVPYRKRIYSSSQEGTTITYLVRRHEPRVSSREAEKPHTVGVVLYA